MYPTLQSRVTRWRTEVNSGLNFLGSSFSPCNINCIMYSADSQTLWSRLMTASLLGLWIEWGEGPQIFEFVRQHGSWINLTSQPSSWAWSRAKKFNPVFLNSCSSFNSVLARWTEMLLLISVHAFTYNKNKFYMPWQIWWCILVLVLHSFTVSSRSRMIEASIVRWGIKNHVVHHQMYEQNVSIGAREGSRNHDGPRKYCIIPMPLQPHSPCDEWELTNGPPFKTESRDTSFNLLCGPTRDWRSWPRVP